MPILFLSALLLLILYVLLIGFYGIGFRQLKLFSGKIIKSVTRVTIIIPARNEAANIETCLQSVFAQTYPKHLTQVLVVDDFSTDATAKLVREFARAAETNNQITTNSATPETELLQLKDFITEGSTNSYKKKGIEIAVGRANGELIVCTDADCTAHENWIQTLVSFYEKTGAAFIAAPVKLSPVTEKKALDKARWRFVEIFQTIDFVTLQGITAGSVYKNLHSMCNGANLAYTKQAFEKVNGFAGIDSIASGDDLLLMHKIKKVFPNDVYYLKSTDAMVQTATVPHWKGFFQQRIRWASKATHYEDKKIFLALLLVYLLNLFTLMLLVSLAFAPQNYAWVLLFIFVKSAVEYWFLWPVLDFYKQGFLKKWFFVCIPFHIVYTVIAGWLGKFGNYAWKGRELRKKISQINFF